MSTLTEARSIAWLLLLLAAGCTPPPRWIAVADRETASILLFEHDLSLADTITLAVSRLGAMRLHFVEFGRDGSSLYVADSGEQGIGRVSAIRLPDGQLLDQWQRPGGQVLEIAALPDSPSIVVTVAAHDSTGPGSIHYLSAGELTPESRLEPCSGSPRGLANLQEVGRGYVRCDDDGEPVVDLDLIQQRGVNSVRLDRDDHNEPPCGPGGISLSRTGGILFVPCSLSGRLLYLDRVALDAIDSFTIGTGISRIAVSPRNAQALVSIPDSNAVAVVDLRRRSVIARIQLPGSPVSVVISGDGKKGYVLTAGSPATLLLIDMGRGSVQKRVQVATGSTNLSIWPGSQSPSMIWR